MNQEDAQDYSDTDVMNDSPSFFVSNKNEDTNDSNDIKVGGGKLYSFFKRTFDIFASGTFLLLFGWIILILMFIKWAEDAGSKNYYLDIVEDEKGKYLAKTGKRYNCTLRKDNSRKKDDTVHGAIYASDRVGKDGKLFKFHKIRSMCPGAERMRKELLRLRINEADEPAFKLKDDPRITKFGRFLRKTSLDELPQIWDIFIGKMSIVGPRPPIPDEVKNYNSRQKHRLDVKGGLLCLWQIHHNRNELTFDEWIDLDLEYVQKRSALLDLKIIFKGAWFVLTDHSGE